TCKNNELEFIKIGLSESCDEFLKKIDSSIMEIIPDGFVFELSTMAVEWWKDAANFLRCGKLIAFDYGFESSGFLNPLFPSGTLRAYQKHHSTNNVLKSPGEQDLTADVNFSIIIKAGENCGLTTEYFGSQELFFYEIVEKLSKSEFPEWFTNNIPQFKTLTHPEHLGRQIKVLVQSKN
ncbi:MAG TPA: SAM-dependent methyltransferase, partial [Verrucomicrobiota bacterium]|nr:SAM-dependent methyltransferase [Verrucomicrobiota bacterium]